MDSLPEDDIEAIWGRIKKPLNLDEINAKNKDDFQRQVKDLMDSAYYPTREGAPYQQSVKFLIEKGIAGRLAKNDKVLKEILQRKVGKTTVKGKQRFIIKKGVPTFASSSGKQIRAGQFLKGKSVDEATQDLVEKTTE